MFTRAVCHEGIHTSARGSGSRGGSLADQHAVIGPPATTTRTGSRRCSAGAGAAAVDCYMHCRLVGVGSCLSLLGLLFGEGFRVTAADE